MSKRWVYEQALFFDTLEFLEYVKEKASETNNLMFTQTFTYDDFEYIFILNEYSLTGGLLQIGKNVVSLKA